MNRKIIYNIHRISGVTIGAFIFLLAVSGVGISFKEELLPVLYPELFHIEPGTQTSPLPDIYAHAQNHLGPDKKITNLYSSEDPEEAYLLLYRDPHSQFPWMLTINQFTGKVVGEMSMIKNFFAIMLFMHANFFMGKIGAYFVGVLGLVLLFFIISGIYIWLPQRNLTQKFKRTFSQYTPGLRMQKIHHALGILFSLFLGISAITGFLTIYDLSYYLMRPLKGEATKVEELERKSSCTYEEQLDVVKMITPEMEKNLISIHFCSQKSGIMKVTYGLRDKDYLNGYGRVTIDPLNKQILQEFNSDTDPSSWNIKRFTIYPLHTGSYLGMTGRIIVFITGLALMMIFMTGVFLFVKRRRKKIKPVEVEA